MDFTTRPIEWFRTANEDLGSAEYSKNAKHYGDYIAKLQHAEEKIAKGCLAIFSILRSKSPDQSIELYFKAISNGTLKSGTVFDFTHDWEEEFFKKVLNKEFLNFIGLPETFISNIADQKQKFDKFKDEKPHISSENIDTALSMSKTFLSFGEGSDPLTNLKDKLSEFVPKELLDNIINSAIKKSNEAAKGMNLPSNIKLIDRMPSGKLMVVLEALMPIHSFLIPHFKADFPSQDGITYDENNPIVVHGSEIESILKEALKRSENLYKELTIVKSNYSK